VTVCATASTFASSATPFGDRVVLAALHESAVVHVLHVYVVCGRFLLSKCNASVQQNRYASHHNFLHWVSPRVNPIARMGTSFMILQGGSGGITGSARCSKSAMQMKEWNWKMEIRS